MDLTTILLLGYSFGNLLFIFLMIAGAHINAWRGRRFYRKHPELIPKFDPPGTDMQAYLKGISG